MGSRTPVNCLGSLFFTANAAATGAGIIWFASYSPYFFLQLRYASLTRADKLFSCLYSNTAMAFALQLVAMFEGSGTSTPSLHLKVDADFLIRRRSSMV